MRGLIGSDQLDSMTGLLSPRLEKFNPDIFSNYVSSPTRGIKVVRGIVFTGCVLFCYLLFTSVATYPEWNYIPSGLGVNATIDDKTSTLFTETTSNIKENAILSLQKTGKPLYYTIHTNEPYDIVAAIRNVLDLCPDEVYTRTLTKPIDMGGEEKLHEIGLRIRMFKKYFDAWEALHVVTDGLSKTAFVRDDILRFIRDTKDLSAITDKTRAQAIQHYEIYRTFLARLSSILFPWTAPYFSDHMTLHGHMYNAGRGIVISGSDAQAHYILTAISSFRALGCELPIEIMYLGDDDLSQDKRDQLEAVPNVTTRNLKQMVNDQGWELSGWAGKAFAAFMSSFREVILLDADVLFFSNPEDLFENPGYVDTGALFFRDRVVWAQDRKSLMRKILPEPVSAKARESRWWKGESGEYQEAGVVVVDKWRHFLSVFLTARLNGPDRGDTDAGKGTYSLWWGDKETWWIGFELAGDTDYHFHQGNTGNMGTVTNTEPIMEAKNGAPMMSKDGFKMNVLDTAAIEAEAKKKLHLELVENESLSSADSEEKTTDLESLEEGTQPQVHKAASEDDGEKSSSPIASETEEIPNNEDLGQSKADHPLSRRHLEKRNWFTEALSTKRPELTGPAMLDFKDQNIILCSPQLLHLSLDGRPLWFNGWIQDNKHEAASKVSEFEFFMSEKRKAGEWAEWAVGNDNMCCLKGDDLHAFNPQEKRAMNLIVGIARGNGALSKVGMPEKDAENETGY